MEGDIMGYRLVVGVSNTDPNPLLMLQAMYDGDLNICNRNNQNPNHKRVYAWKISGRDSVRTFLSSIEPYSLVKRDQILIALRYLDTVEKPGKRLQQSVWDIRRKCYDDMQLLNKRGAGQSLQREIPQSPLLGWNPRHRGLSKEDLERQAAHMRSYIGKG